MTIKKGMIVYLKSGGPAMTIHSLARPNVWICQWFVGTTLKSGHFNVNQLTDEKPI